MKLLFTKWLGDRQAPRRTAHCVRSRRTCAVDWTPSVRKQLRLRTVTGSQPGNMASSKRI
eukprot:m.1304588 g.1304588  ORF g.1304588 m.1304588 type:complete len:60 (-) comp24812_c0_seq14:2252-2431(-)